MTIRLMSSVLAIASIGLAADILITDAKGTTTLVKNPAFYQGSMSGSTSGGIPLKISDSVRKSILWNNVKLAEMVGSRTVRVSTTDGKTIEGELIIHSMTPDLTGMNAEGDAIKIDIANIKTMAPVKAQPSVKKVAK